MTVEARPRIPSTGLVYAEGVIITANHTVEWDEDIEIVLPNGEEAPATLAGRDPATDLAVLTVETKGLKVAEWADGENLKVGNLVLGVARPGDSNWATLGIVSALSGDWRTGGGGKIDRYIQTSLEQFPGLSGSPLLDLDGKVLGLNTTGLLRGFRLAIPAATVKRVAEELLNRGQIQRGYLGVTSYPVRLPESLGETSGQGHALIVTSVQLDSPADKAGLLLGDVLLALDGKPVRHIGDLVGVLDADRIGTRIALKIVRAGKADEIKVTVGARS